jgi:putative transposase
MPLYHRHYERGHLQFITTSTYRRVRLFADPQYCPLFVDALRAVRAKFQFRLSGWVLMPEHFHVLLQPVVAESTSDIVKDVKQRSAFAVLEALRAQSHLASCRTLLRWFRLPASVHDHAHYRVWQRRFVPFGVYTEKKCREKLDYMRNNPVKRGLAASPGGWPWSSWRFYYIEDRSILEMDRLD